MGHPTAANSPDTALTEFEIGMFRQDPWNTQSEVIEIPREGRNSTSANSLIETVVHGTDITLVATLNQYGPTPLFGVFQSSPGIGNASHRAFRSRKNLVSLIPPPTQYTPYVPIDDEHVRHILQSIGKDFQLIDAGFAEFYRVAISHGDWVNTELERLHDAYRNGRSDGTNYPGALGHFLERCAGEKAKSKTVPSERFRSEDRRADTLLCYLQDGFEDPYWEILSDRFIQSCEFGEANTLYKTFVFHVVTSVVSRTRLRLQKLKMEYACELPNAIQDRIQSRLIVLKNMVASITPDTGLPEDLYAYASQRTQRPGTPKYGTATVGSVHSASNEDSTDFEKVSSSMLFILFFALATIPACIGFARYWGMGNEEEAVGLSTDADFMWLIAGNLLALLGNLFAILPLFKLTRGSLRHLLTQAALWLSVALGIASIASYCFVNKCWSSLMSFFSNFFAISAVYFSTQHVGSQNLAEEKGDLAKKMKKE
ncbi:hypothetical protein PG993_003869 [Apiospora rasikravindrae]|uniref:Uncharacterized protein n=1 Tax=Apiospora rasikravindrae TaxID=990691 RepID=A0ABR1U0R0_9PEZI